LTEILNSQLISNIGNFAYRLISFTCKQFDGKVPACSLIKEDEIIIAEVDAKLKNYIQELNQVHLKEGLKIALKISNVGNKYFQGN
jgi:methionyl-tRNA synthetase